MYGTISKEITGTLMKSLQKFDIIDMYYYMTFNDVH